MVVLLSPVLSFLTDFLHLLHLLCNREPGSTWSSLSRSAELALKADDIYAEPLDTGRRPVTMKQMEDRKF